MTSDRELESNYPCPYRFEFDTRLWCGRLHLPRFLKTVKRCEACDKRLPSLSLFQRRMDTNTMRIGITHKELTIRDRLAQKRLMQIQLEGNSYFYTCEAEDRYVDSKGYELRSDKCPNRELRSRWHPVEACKEIECHCLKPSDKVIRNRSGSEKKYS